MKIVIKLVLLVVIVGLGYMIVESVMEPVRFNKQKDIREALVIQNLEDIRVAEIAYKTVNGSYMSDWDTLIDFVRNTEFPIVKEIADPNDTTNSIIIRDTIGYVSIMDSLYSHREAFNVSNLKYVPIPREFFDNEQFELQAGKITRGGLPVPVFECKVPYSVLLKGLDHQLIINLNKQVDEMNKYTGLKVGSMEEASNEGTGNRNIQCLISYKLRQIIQIRVLISKL